MRIDSILRTRTGAGSGAGLIATVRAGETKLSEVAERLDLPVAALRRANRHLKSDHVKRGQTLLLPAGLDVADRARSTELPGTMQTGEPSRPSGLDKPGTGDPIAKALAQLQLRRGVQSFASAGSESASRPTTTSPTLALSGSTEVDPRFAAINDALQAGNGKQAMGAARELLALLKKERPPQPRLLNQARMSIAAGAMLAGDLDAAQKSLAAVNTKALKHGETGQYAQLRGLLKDARHEAYSGGFQLGQSLDASGSAGTGTTSSGRVGNPFAGQPSGAVATGASSTSSPTVRALTAPSIPPPPPMTNKQATISLATTSDAVLHNSARSVQASNAKYNEQAYESYNKAVQEWQDNGGRRWIGGNAFAYTPEPPPVPQYLPTDHNAILADIAANYQAGRPPEDVNAKRPYYMGGSVFFDTKVS